MTVTSSRTTTPRRRTARVQVLGLAAGAWAAGAAGAFAQQTAALVEDVAGGIETQIQFMDYLPVGKTISLGSGDTLTLGYLRSCWRETIRGGVVTVGAEQSDVKGGQVRRQKVECDGGRMRLTSQQAGQSGVMVFRGAPRPAAGPTTADAGAAAANAASYPTVHGLSPVVEVKAPGKLLLERLDKPGERQEFEVTSAQLVRGSFYDFYRQGWVLAPGGLYRASNGSGQATFRVDTNAKPGATPIVGRLVRF